MKMSTTLMDNSGVIVPAVKSSVAPVHHIRPRETWDRKIEFLLAIIGFCVDLGNVWRFPYICYQNGGGAFLIPYTVMLVLGGMPLFYLELALGQYYRSGCISIWRYICPLFKGVGFGICVIASYMSFYYNTIISTAIYYIFASFQSELPWAKCNHTWNTGNCSTNSSAPGAEHHVSPAEEYYLWDILTLYGVMVKYEITAVRSYNREIDQVFVATGVGDLGCRGGLTGRKLLSYVIVSFVFPCVLWNIVLRQVLEIHHSTGLDDIGVPRWQFVGGLALVFIMVYFALWKGPKSSGKAVWVTAISPFIVLFILLIRGLTLQGSHEGLRFFLTPNWDRLYDPEVWSDAAAQVFFSLGPGFGVLLALASYNPINNNFYRDALLTSFINFFASFLSGLVVFSVLGYLSLITGKKVEEVVQDGPGLVFVAYPTAIAAMPGAQFWSVLFFIMLASLGLDSTFGGLEAILTAISDEWPERFAAHRKTFCLAIVIYCFLGSLPTTTYGGQYVLTLLDNFGPTIAIIFIVFVEAAAMCWFYGVRRISADVNRMLGYRPGIFWIACWTCISPLFMLLVFILTLTFRKPLVLNNYTFPDWSIEVGWALTSSSIMCIPIYMIYKLAITKGTLWERIIKSIQPEEYFVDPLETIALKNGQYKDSAE